MSQEALGRQWVSAGLQGGGQVHHLVSHGMAKAIKQGRVRHMAGLRGLSRGLSETALDQPLGEEDLAKGFGQAVSRIKPGTRIRLRSADPGEEEAGDEDITARPSLWHPEGTHYLTIHHPRAVTQFESADAPTGPGQATARGAPRLHSWADNEFFHHTSDPAARDIIHRVRSGQPGLLLSRGGDTGPGIYTSADRTAWSHIGGRREHPGWEIAMHLHGARSLGAGPGGAGMYDPDPPKRVSRRFYNIGREGQSWGSGGHRRGGVDPNFWREHGYDTVVTGGKETIATHPLQVQILRAMNKATGEVHHFEDTLHRHYRPDLRVQEGDYSPRQERN